jgi:hypothetical protein
MSLLGKRPPKLLVLMLTAAALACAAMMLAASAPAFAAPKEPLFITDVSPEPGATNEPVDTLIQAVFDHELLSPRVRPNMHLTNVETGEDVRRPLEFDPFLPTAGGPTLTILLKDAPPPLVTTPLECGTTYEVSVSGKGRGAVKGFDGGKLSGVLDERVTFERRTASWTFTTGPC